MAGELTPDELAAFQQGGTGQGLGSTADLESRIGTGSPGAYLSSQQPDQGEQPFVQDQGGATLAMGPQSAPPEYQPTGTKDGIKNLLTNFFGQHGVAGYLMNSFGMPTPEQQQIRQQHRAMQQQLNQSTIDYHQALAKNLADQNELVPIQQGPDAQGNPQEPLYVARRSQATILAKQLGLQQQAKYQQINSMLSAAGKGFQIVDDANGQPMVQPMTQEQLSLPQQATIKQKEEGKSPTEMRLRVLSDQGDPQATRVLAKLQEDRKALQAERGISFARGRAEYTPFETVEPGTNIPTTISNLQALRTGAPKVPMGTQAKLGGQYALFNDAYGILDKIDSLVGNQPGQVNLDDSGVSQRVAAGYAALKEPAAKGLTGELLSNVLARQPIYGSLTGPERELVLTMAQGKAAGTGLRSILGQAGTNEMQQRLDSAMFPAGQTAATVDSLKQQTEATRKLLDRFVVGQPQFGLNAPGQPSALQTKRGIGEPTRPANVPKGYIFKANGPKGAGWYKP